VTTADSGLAIQAVSVKLYQSDNTIDEASTGDDGSFILKNLVPGSYEIEASKPTYGNVTKDAVVTSAQITEINFDLSRIQTAGFSDSLLDFGADLTAMSFTISNLGVGTLRYSLLPNQGWITVDHASGEVTTEPDTIKVFIDRTGFSGKKQEGSITITSSVGDESVHNEVAVFVNGVIDPEGNYYGIIRIGTQTWMAENLNSGVQIYLGYLTYPANNDDVEKFCYDDDPAYCDTFGGLYSWSELMDYSPHDSGTIGTTQGICPEGWHVPTKNEWETLGDYLGGLDIAGGALKDTGNIQDGTGLWEFPNEGATNESGFTSLPGGDCYWEYYDAPWPNNPTEDFDLKGESSSYWTASMDNATMGWDREDIHINSKYIRDKQGNAVRCIKDP